MRRGKENKPLIGGRENPPFQNHLSHASFLSFPFFSAFLPATSPRDNTSRDWEILPGGNPNTCG